MQVSLVGLRDVARNLHCRVDMLIQSWVTLLLAVIMRYRNIPVLSRDKGLCSFLRVFWQAYKRGLGEGGQYSGVFAFLVITSFYFNFPIQSPVMFKRTMPVILFYLNFVIVFFITPPAIFQRFSQSSDSILRAVYTNSQVCKNMNFQLTFGL